MILLPLTMSLLVGATGFFALNMARRAIALQGSHTTELARMFDQIFVQVLLIALIAAILGIGLAIGVTTPLRAFADKLEAMASGDLSTSFDAKSAPEAEWLAGAFNDAIAAVNRYVFQSMTGAVITLNTEGRIIGSSPSAEMILGYREDEIVGRRFSEVFAPEGGGRAELAALETSITRREAVPSDEVYIAGKDGRRIRIGLSISYLRRGDRPHDGAADDSDEVIGVTIGFKDLNEIRRLRDHLRRADQLVALGTLTAGVAHELRNPLASMRGLAELLGRDFADTDPKRLYVSTMIEAIDRLNKLVENLLLLSSDSAPASEQVDVERVVRDVTSFARLGLGARRVTVSNVRDEAADGTIVLAARHRLEQAVTNIVLNAVQAAPDDGVVTIRTGSHDQNVSIRVHNTGSYISPDRMKRLFVPFYTTRPTGTGLGLAIARQIVTAYGGRIDVESDETAGTTFAIELPAGQPEGIITDDQAPGPALLTETTRSS